MPVGTRTGEGNKCTMAIVKNVSTKVLGIGNTVIASGMEVELDQSCMDNPAVIKWIRSGILILEKESIMSLSYIKDRPLRVIHFVHTLFNGGAERSTLELHRGLKEYYIVQGLVNLYNNPNQDLMLSEEAREIFDFMIEENIAGYDIDHFNALIQSIIVKFKPDIILYSLCAKVPEAIYRMVDRKPVIQIHHSELGPMVDSFRPGKVDGLVTVSQHMADMLPAKAKQLPVYPIWNGINPERVKGGHSLRRELNIPNNGFIIGMVGNINSVKRPWFGLEAMSKVFQKNIYMVFAGNPADQTMLEGAADKLGLRNNIRVLGQVVNIKDILATIQLLINCSTSEGLPVSIIEAMFAGVPVIATAVGGNAEVVLHDYSGFVYGIDDMNALARYIALFYSKRALLKEMGAQAKERAETYFTADRMVEDYWSVLNEFVINADAPRCSIVMPVYNGERFLMRSIASIKAQTMPHFDCIVIDDGSDDNSLKAIFELTKDDPRFRIISQPHTGIVIALNNAIKEAKCDLIVRMDCDDAMYIDRLEKQLEYMQAYPEIDVLGSQIDMKGMDGKHIRDSDYPLEHDDIVTLMITNNPLAHPATCYRKSAWEKAGGYKGDGRAEDYRMWVEMSLAGLKFHNLPDKYLDHYLSHGDDPAYGKWVNSAVEDIQRLYKEGLDAIQDQDAQRIAGTDRQPFQENAGSQA